jgi:hypothetical protein
LLACLRNMPGRCLLKLACETGLALASGTASCMVLAGALDSSHNCQELDSHLHRYGGMWIDGERNLNVQCELQSVS